MNQLVGALLLFSGITFANGPDRYPGMWRVFKPLADSALAAIESAVGVDCNNIPETDGLIIEKAFAVPFYCDGGIYLTIEFKRSKHNQPWRFDALFVNRQRDAKKEIALDKGLALAETLNKLAGDYLGLVCEKERPDGYGGAIPSSLCVSSSGPIGKGRWTKSRIAPHKVNLTFKGREEKRELAIIIGIEPTESSSGSKQAK